jgi:3-oxoacyl-[acyl-carrier protein] reductase
MTDGKVVVITGTSKGIGEYLTRRFLDDGAIVEGCARSPAEWTHERFQHSLCDVTDPKALDQWFFEIGQRHPTIDILVNNAGAAVMNHMVTTPAASIEKLLSLNLAATYNCCRNAVRLLRKSKSGTIINFSTIAVPLRLPGEAIYSATKAGVEQLTRVFAKELYPLNITCNCVGPAPIQTDLIKGIPEKAMADLLGQLPTKSLGAMEDVYFVVKFFAAEEARSVTGQVVYLGGVS